MSSIIAFNPIKPLQGDGSSRIKQPFSGSLQTIPLRNEFFGTKPPSNVTISAPKFGANVLQVAGGMFLGLVGLVLSVPTGITAFSGHTFDDKNTSVVRELSGSDPALREGGDNSVLAPSTVEWFTDYLRRFNEEIKTENPPINGEVGLQQRFDQEVSRLRENLTTADQDKLDEVLKAKEETIKSLLKAIAKIETNEDAKKIATRAINELFSDSKELSTYDKAVLTDIADRYFDKLQLKEAYDRKSMVIAFFMFALLASMGGLMAFISLFE